jgi:single-strand DNA-binding protein
MSSVNKVILVGRVGRDPEMRQTAGGMEIANISLATSLRRKGEEETEWHRVIFFDKLAGVVGQYVRKGSLLYVEGRIKYGKFTAQDGTERQTTDIIVNELQLLPSGSGENTSAKAPAPTPRQPASRPPATRPPVPAAGTGFEDMDDDIPFN